MKIKLRAQKTTTQAFQKVLQIFEKVQSLSMSRPKCIRKPMNLKVFRKHKNLERSTKKDDSTANIPIRESLRNMGKLSEIGECLEKHYHVAYHIALRGCQYTDLVHELEVQKLHKVEFFKSSSYENESVCREFINFCSKSLFNQTVKEKHQKTITILCDRSTDSAVVEKECIYVLFADPEIFHSTI